MACSVWFKSRFLYGSGMQSLAARVRDHAVEMESDAEEINRDTSAATPSSGG